MTTAAPSNAILRRHFRTWEERKVGWVPYISALALSPCLAAALGRGFRELYVVGGWDAKHTPDHEWWKAPAQDGWAVTYRPGNKHSLRTGEYVRGDKKLTVRMSAAWFDDYDNVPQMAMEDLRTLMHRHFDPFAHPMGTPGRTGQDLLERTLPRGRAYLPSPLDVQDTIRHNSGQGRRRYEGLPSVESVRSIAVYDGVWMYASCLRHLPVILADAPLRYDSDPDYAGPYVPAFYRVIFRVPDGWEHPGLLAYRDPDSGEVSWPRSGRAAYEAWVTGPELEVALRPPPGFPAWRVRIRERILYAHSSSAGADPAREWIAHLRAMREAAQSKAVKAAIRHLCLDTVGSWARAERTEWHVVPGGDDLNLPTDVDRIIPTYAYDRHHTPVKLLHTEWSRRVPLDPTAQPFVRPEWAAMVWGRARAKLNAFMLTFPPAAILWCRDDALAVNPLTDNVPTESLADPETPGHFRVKQLKSWASDVAVPRDETTYRALMGEGDEGGSDNGTQD